MTQLNDALNESYALPYKETAALVWTANLDISFNMILETNLAREPYTVTKCNL